MDPAQDARRALVGALARVGDRAAALPQLADAVRLLLSSKLTPALDTQWEALGYGLVRCGTELPHKASVYATIAGVLTATHNTTPHSPTISHPPPPLVSESPASHMLASYLVTGVRNYFAQSLRDGQAGPARRALRFLAELVVAGVAHPASLVTLIEVLIAAAISERDNDARSPLHARPVYLADTALSTLPWVADLLARTFPDRWHVILQDARVLCDLYGHMDRWAPMFAAADLHPQTTHTPPQHATASPDQNNSHINTNAADPASAKLPFRISVLDFINAALTDLQTTNYQCPALLRIQPLFAEQLANGRKIEFAPVNVLAHSKTSRYAPPRFWWSILPSSPDTLIPPVEQQQQQQQQNQQQGHPSHTPPVKDEGLPPVKIEGLPPVKGELVHPDQQQQPDETASHKTPKKEEDVHMDTASPTKPLSQSDTLPATEDKQVLSLSNNDPTALLRPAERYFVRELLSDVLDNFCSNHALAAQHISDLPLPMPIESEIVQSVFSAMCSLPAPQTACVYYAVIFVDLCRVMDSKVPMHLLASINAILVLADRLDPEEFDRLTEWFGHHLSNYKYKFNWHDWNRHASAKACCFKRLFCQDVLARCCRLTFVESFKQDIPDLLHPLLPPPVEFVPVDEMDEITPQLTAVVTGKGHLPAAAVKEKLELLMPEASELQRAVQFIRAVLVASSKTYSHFDIIAQRYLELLQEYVANDTQTVPQALATEVRRFWTNGPQWTDYILDKMIAFQILTTDHVVQTVLQFPADSLQDLMAYEKASVWEHIRSVFERVRTRAQTLKEEVAALAKFASSAPEGEMDKAADDLDRVRAESKTVTKTLEGIVSLALKGLVVLYAKVKEVQERDGVPQGDVDIIEWRILGMIHELARRNCASISVDDTNQLLEEAAPSKATELLGKVLDFGTSAMLLPD